MGVRRDREMRKGMGMVNGHGEERRMHVLLCLTFQYSY